jgi:TRAP-type C4-dicarboxylate transport system permease small subunit
MLDGFSKLLTRLSNVIALIGAIGIFALMIITLVAVFWRYIVNDPIYGISDLSVLTLSVVAATSVCFGARHNAHVSVNVMSYFFGRKVTRVTDVFMRILALGTLLVAAYALIHKACGFEKACITDNLSIEHRPFFYVLAVCMLLYAAHILWQLLVGLKHFNDTDPNEPAD